MHPSVPEAAATIKSVAVQRSLGNWESGSMLVQLQCSYIQHCAVLEIVMFHISFQCMHFITTTGRVLWH